MSIYRGRNRRDFYLSSLLYDSIDDNNLRAVKKLLCEKGADPNLVLPKRGISPFHLAIGCDCDDFSEKVTNLILQYGGNPNVRSDDGLTPVHIAAAWKRLAILKLLLNCGGDVEARDANAMTPFHYAKKEDFIEGLNLMKLHRFSQDVERDEKKDCLKFTLDKIYIDNGFEIGEYEIVDSYEPNSIKPLEKLNNLPQSDTNEYVLNWFNNHIDDVGGTTFIKLPAKSKSSTDSDGKLSFESSIDESDNENQRNHKMLDITFRKIYRKRRNATKDSPKLNSDDKMRETNKKSVIEDTFEIQSCESKEYSSESGIVTLPSSKENLVDAQRISPNSNIQSSDDPITTASMKPTANLEDKCSGYKSFGDNKTNICNSCDMQANNINSEFIEKESAAQIVQPPLLKSDNSSEYLTCTLNSMLEKNIFDIPNEKTTESQSIASFVSVISEVYKYEDQAEGIILYERRLLKAPSEFNGSLRTESTSSKMSSLPENIDYDVESIRKELTLLGFNPGPITATTKRVYLKKLFQLKKNPPVPVNIQGIISKREYSVELQKTLRTSEWLNNISVYKELDEIVLKEFSNPNPSRKWREGTNKSSFTYLLLDPRKTNNLPGRAEVLDKQEIWETFLSAVFYVGKGKRARPYAHLYDTVDLWNKGIFNTANKKIQRILDIWKNDGGVICLHVFQNVIPVEAYTREAAMINAFKIDNLTNAKSGDYYGIAATWNERRKRMLGVYLLYKAMHIFLHEGERQLSPRDID